MDRSTQPAVVRFGDYEADLRCGELKRQGHRLKLQDKPFQVLAALLMRPGELVTRDALRQSLWPSDTFVDFEHGLNTAVNKLREVLRDSASNPRFIETLPRRGYRFIAPVTTPEETQHAATLTSSLQAAGELPRADRRTSRWLLLMIEVAYLVSYVAALHYLHSIAMLARFSFGPKVGFTITSIVALWSALGLPVRFYLGFALAFDYHLLAEKFHRLFPFVLPFDEFWAAMAIFLIPTIGPGFAFALLVAGIYSPFAQRALVRMAYPHSHIGINPSPLRP